MPGRRSAAAAARALSQLRCPCGGRAAGWPAKTRTAEFQHGPPGLAPTLNTQKTYRPPLPTSSIAAVLRPCCTRAALLSPGPVVAAQPLRYVPATPAPPCLFPCLAPGCPIQLGRRFSIKPSERLPGRRRATSFEPLRNLLDANAAAPSINRLSLS
jgi:hypothetical protein